MDIVNNISATEAKTRFGEILMNSMRAPVVINKNKKNVAALISIYEYEHLKELAEMEDEILGQMAVQAEKQGHYIGTKKSQELIDDILNS